MKKPSMPQMIDDFWTETLNDEPPSGEPKHVCVECLSQPVAEPHQLCDHCKVEQGLLPE